MFFPAQLVLVLVTHDRFMLERIATEYLGLDGSGNAKSFQTHEEWTTARTAAAAAAQREANAAKPKAAAKRKKPGARKFTNKERREYESMEDVILEAEADVERLETEAASPDIGADHVKATALYETLAAAQERVRELYARWAVLEAIKQGEAPPEPDGHSS